MSNDPATTATPTGDTSSTLKRAVGQGSVLTGGLFIGTLLGFLIGESTNETMTTPEKAINATLRSTDPLTYPRNPIPYGNTHIISTRDGDANRAVQEVITQLAEKPEARERLQALRDLLDTLEAQAATRVLATDTTAKEKGAANEAWVKRALERKGAVEAKR